MLIEVCIYELALLSGCAFCISEEFVSVLPF